MSLQSINSYSALTHLKSTKMSVVYKAQNEKGDSRALKFGPRKLIWEEYGLLRELRHPNIVGVKSWGHFCGRPDSHMQEVFDPGQRLGYFAMEFLEGVNPLLLLQSFSFSPHYLVEQMIKISEGLLPLWRKGLGHGDIRPANIIFGSRGFVLCDLGVLAARLVDGYVSSFTWEYVPKEVVLDPSLPIDLSFDSYSIGFTIYSLITMKPLSLMVEDPETGEKVKVLNKGDTVLQDPLIPLPLQDFLLRTAGNTTRQRPSDPEQYIAEMREVRRKLVA